MKGISQLILQLFIVSRYKLSEFTEELPLRVWHFCSYGINTNSKIYQGSLKSYDRQALKNRIREVWQYKVTSSQNVLAICDYMQNVFNAHWNELDYVIILCLHVVCSTNLENILKCLYCLWLLGVFYV